MRIREETEKKLREEEEKRKILVEQDRRFREEEEASDTYRTSNPFYRHDAESKKRNYKSNEMQS